MAVKANELNEFLKSSNWTTIMRVQLRNDPSAEHFAIQLLHIENWKITIIETTRVH